MMPKTNTHTRPASSPARRRRPRGTTRRSGRRFSAPAGAASPRRCGRVMRGAGRPRRTAGAGASRVVVVATRAATRRRRASRRRAGGPTRPGGWLRNSAGVGFHAPAAAGARCCTASHTHGRPGGQVQPPVTAWRNRSFTMRSSPEWYASTATRPPGAVASMAASMASGRICELAVDLDADGLEGALGRMAAAAAGRRRDGVADDVGQLAPSSRSGGRPRWRRRCGWRSARRRAPAAPAPARARCSR